MADTLIHTIAKQLDGSEYPINRRDISDLTTLAKQNGIVIVMGASDDLTEFYGSISGEEDAYGGGEFWITGDGLYPDNMCDCDNCPNYIHPTPKTAVPLRAVWCGESGASWEFEFPVKHAIFNVMEDGGIYCAGIVFALADVAEYLKEKSNG